MTKLQFLKKMNEIKSLNLKYILGVQRWSVCDVLSKELGIKSAIYFRETFCPYKDYYSFLNKPYFMSYDVSQRSELDIEEATENRINALLLFEQQVLDYKLYKKF